jgi:predicted Zn-ribbon and HTH transcriptional regulator
MKNNIGFFTHETEALDHRKFVTLRAYYGGEKGWAMEAKFWGLNCMIGKAENCRLDTTKKGEKPRIARALELSLKELDDFLTILRDEAELLKDDAGILTTEQTQQDLSRAIAARKKMQNWRDGKQEEPQNSNDTECNGNNPECNGYETHGGEGIGEEKKREELGAARAFIKLPRSEENREAAFIAYSLEIAKERKAGNPESYARSLRKKKDVIAAFEAEWSQGNEADPERMKAPDPCPHCGGKTIETSTHFESLCPGCKTSWTYDEAFDNWNEDAEKLVPLRSSGDEFDDTG